MFFFSTWSVQTLIKQADFFIVVRCIYVKYLTFFFVDQTETFYEDNEEDLQRVLL